MAKQLTESFEVGSGIPERQGYAGGWEHLADELKRVDLLIRLAWGRQNGGERDRAMDPFRGLVITEDEVAGLLQAEGGRTGRVEANEADKQLELRLAILDETIERKIGISARAGVYLPLPYLAEMFDLSGLEAQAIVFCLAVELDRKYEKLFGFLQDDVTCRFPTIDLIFKLLDLTEEQKLDSRSLFSPKRPLMRYMFRASADAESRPVLTRPLQLDERIVRFLTQQESLDETMAAFASMRYPSDSVPGLLLDFDIQERMRTFMDASRRKTDEERDVVFLLHGPEGAGKKLQIMHFCRHYEQPLLLVDLKLLSDESGKSKSFHLWLEHVFREAILLQAVIAFTNVHTFIPEESVLPEEQEALQGRGSWARLDELISGIRSFHGVIFLLSEKAWRPAALTGRGAFIEVSFAIPDNLARKALWETFGASHRVASNVDWGVTAGKFRLTPGKIRAALATARDVADWTNGAGSAIGEDELYRACYMQVQHRLEKRATRLTPRYTWDDVILPPEQKEQLKNACNQMKFRHVVYGEWGFDRKLSYGKGLSMLFAGPPGTGKTMSAEVIASELRLEIYKIDLSQVISKYIGETEKNLQEVFQEAQLSNAILFFDETDALFGKRSEVKSSHDKYANVEVAFLLQKMEEYEGISVLATNYLQNIDEAFMRRLNYVIKYPFPDADYREQIWRSMFPKEAPLSDDVDFRFLGRTFQIAGGNIKNTVVSAAFLAAERREPIGMKHILKAAIHEIAKSGAMVLKEQLGVYNDLLVE
ncbi:ATP-binding protein [Paenibacillus contaminans]|uniref:AAA family ATPase n=1 Tax=Paenibacillus contaminans TaxID=450362 RepID=A0A329MLL7_9BACL|nr:ATP-binding protein [Paenibacillus contaminans]RAV20502.1 AAA family ATPase [Paenibacillus contaminans]